MGSGYTDTSLEGYGTNDGSTNPMWGNDIDVDTDGDIIGVYDYDDGHIRIMSAANRGESMLVDGYISIASHAGSGCSPSHTCNEGGISSGLWSMTEFKPGETGVDILTWLADVSNPGSTSEGLTDYIAGGSLGTGMAFTSAEEYDPIRDIGIGIIAAGSIGLAQLPIKTQYNDSDTGTEQNEVSAIWITYGNPDEPVFNAAGDGSTTDGYDEEQISGGGGLRYSSHDPWQLDVSEAIALRLKFGHRPAWIEDGGSPGDGPLFQALSASMMSIVESIVTTFPENVLTFARTKPLKLGHKDISNIEADEEYQDFDFSTDSGTEY